MIKLATSTEQKQSRNETALEGCQCVGLGWNLEHSTATHWQRISEQGVTTDIAKTHTVQVLAHHSTHHNSPKKTKIGPR